MGGDMLWLGRSFCRAVLSLRDPQISEIRVPLGGSPGPKGNLKVVKCIYFPVKPYITGFYCTIS